MNRTRVEVLDIKAWPNQHYVSASLYVNPQIQHGDQKWSLSRTFGLKDKSLKHNIRLWRELVAVQDSIGKQEI